MNVIIAGDLVPTFENEKHFQNGDINLILDKNLIKKLDNADFRIFNLETPLTNSEEKLIKNGPNLKASPTSINGILKLQPNLLLLANNHIMDYSIEGYLDTVRILEENKIDYIGVGTNLQSLKKSLIITKSNMKIGIYNCAETEFSIATRNTPGANPFNPLSTYNDIKKLKSQVEYLIVVYHGGKEYYRYPSPNLQDVCRMMIDVGADFVVTQHSHCIGSQEVYKEKRIVYGQGNFIFLGENNEYWNSGFLINLEFTNSIEIDFIPYLATETGIRIANNEEKRKILTEFEIRSREITKDGFISEKYCEFSRHFIDNYLRSLSGQNKWLSRIDRKIFKGKLLITKYKKDKLLRILNYIECEAHRELLIEGLKDWIYNKK